MKRLKIFLVLLLLLTILTFATIDEYYEIMKIELKEKGYSNYLIYKWELYSRENQVCIIPEFTLWR